MGSTANSDYSSFPFLFKNTVLTLRDRGMEREQNRAPQLRDGLGSASAALSLGWTLQRAGSTGH